MQSTRDDLKFVQTIQINCNYCNSEMWMKPCHIDERARKNQRGLFCSKNCSIQYKQEYEIGTKPQLELLKLIPLEEHIYVYIDKNTGSIPNYHPPTHR